MHENLQTFIRHARDRGFDHGTIRTLLLAAGWKDRDIAGAMANEGLELAVPEPAGARGARDAFLHLLTFASLYITVTSVIVLFYLYLDYLFPDPAWGDWYAEAALDPVRYAIAAVIVGFPLFLLLTVILERGLLKQPDSQVHPARRWLTYLTLFLAAAVVLGDVITLLYYFLDGALTARFVLKAVVLLVIAEVVLSYYFLLPRAASNHQPSRLRPFIVGAALVLVAGSLVLGFAMAGSPFSARLRRLDDKRIEDLRAIHRTLQQMATERNNTHNTVKLVRPLPKTLEEVAAYQRTKEMGRRLDLTDPQTGEKFVYTITGEKTYELHATFALPREKKRDLFWNHPAGPQGFKFDAESPPGGP
jgi:hypothetical protein